MRQKAIKIKYIQAIPCTVTEAHRYFKKRMYKHKIDKEWKEPSDEEDVIELLRNDSLFKSIFQSQEDLDVGEPVGEDIGFYMKAKKEGFRIWVDCSIKIGHLATMVIVEESYFAFKQSNAWDRESSVSIPEKAT